MFLVFKGISERRPVTDLRAYVLHSPIAGEKKRFEGVQLDSDFAAVKHWRGINDNFLTKIEPVCQPLELCT